jgi:hypothetical protein
MQTIASDWADVAVTLPCHAILAQLQASPALAPQAWLQELQQLVGRHCAAPPAWAPPAAAIAPTLLPAAVLRNIAGGPMPARSGTEAVQTSMLTPAAGHWPPGLAEGCEAGSNLHALLEPLRAHLQLEQGSCFSPERVHAACAELWHRPACLRAYAEAIAVSAGAFEQGLEGPNTPERVASLAFLLVALLSHLTQSVAACAGRLYLTVPHRYQIQLLPVLAWRLRLEVCTNASPLQPPIMVSAAAMSSSADPSPPGLPAVAQLQRLLAELPAPAEMLCLPHAFLQMHRSACAIPEVLAAALHALELARGTLALRWQGVLRGGKVCKGADAPDGSTGGGGPGAADTQGKGSAPASSARRPPATERVGTGAGKSRASSQQVQEDTASQQGTLQSQLQEASCVAVHLQNLSIAYVLLALSCGGANNALTSASTHANVQQAHCVADSYLQHLVVADERLLYTLLTQNTLPQPAVALLVAGLSDAQVPKLAAWLHERLGTRPGTEDANALSSLRAAASLLRLHSAGGEWLTSTAGSTEAGAELSVNTQDLCCAMLTNVDSLMQHAEWAGELTELAAFVDVHWLREASSVKRWQRMLRNVVHRLEQLHKHCGSCVGASKFKRCLLQSANTLLPGLPPLKKRLQSVNDGCLGVSVHHET